MRAPVPARLLLAALVCLAAACGGPGTTPAAALKASVDELDRLDPPEAGKAGTLAALQTTLAGVDGDSLLSTLPAIVKDLEWIDTAWTALDQRIEQTCGQARWPGFGLVGGARVWSNRSHDDGGPTGAGRRASSAAGDAQGGRAGSRLGRARLR
jgi:hypothetical protein